MPTNIAEAVSVFFAQYGSLFLLAGLFLVMILMTVIPQKKQQKKINEMLNSMKAGDYVRTVGGFFGTIESIDGDVIILKAGPQKQRIAISKRAVSVVSGSDVENTMSDTL